MFDDTWYMYGTSQKHAEKCLQGASSIDVRWYKNFIFPRSEVWPLFRACYNMKLLMFQEQVVEWQNGHREGFDVRSLDLKNVWICPKISYTLWKFVT